MTDKCLFQETLCSQCKSTCTIGCFPLYNILQISVFPLTSTLRLYRYLHLWRYSELYIQNYNPIKLSTVEAVVLCLKTWNTILCVCVLTYMHTASRDIKITIRYSTWKNYNGCINVKVKSFSLTIFYVKIIFYAYQYFSNLLCCIWLYLVFIIFINSQFYSSGCTQFFKIRKNIIPNFPRRSYYIGSLHFTHPFNGKSLK